MRRGSRKGEGYVCAFNFTPVPVNGFVIGLPENGVLREVFTSDDLQFGGGGRQHTGAITALPEEFAGHPYRAAINLPPMTAVYFEYKEEASL